MVPRSGVSVSHSGGAEPETGNCALSLGPAPRRESSACQLWVTAEGEVAVSLELRERRCPELSGRRSLTEGGGSGRGRGLTDRRDSQ